LYSFEEDVGGGDEGGVEIAELDTEVGVGAANGGDLEIVVSQQSRRRRGEEDLIFFFLQKV